MNRTLHSFMSDELKKSSELEATIYEDVGISKNEYDALNKGRIKEVKWEGAKTVLKRVGYTFIVSALVGTVGYLGIRFLVSYKDKQRENELIAQRTEMQNKIDFLKEKNQSLEDSLIAEHETTELALEQRNLAIQEKEEYQRAFVEVTDVLMAKLENQERGGRIRDELVEEFETAKGAASLSSATVDELRFAVVHYSEYVDNEDYERQIDQTGLTKYVSAWGFRPPLQDIENAIVTSEDGERDWIRWINGSWKVIETRYHGANDIKNLVNPRIIAPYGGIITWAQDYHKLPKGDPRRKWGRTIYFQPFAEELEADGITDGPYRYQLSHLDDTVKLMVTPGQIVYAGDVIGIIGNTGLSGDDHLHWAVWRPVIKNKLKGMWETVKVFMNSFIKNDVIYMDYLNRPK